MPVAVAFVERKPGALDSFSDALGLRGFDVGAAEEAFEQRRHTILTYISGLLPLGLSGPKEPFATDVVMPSGGAWAQQPPTASGLHAMGIAVVFADDAWPVHETCFHRLSVTNARVDDCAAGAAVDDDVEMFDYAAGRKIALPCYGLSSVSDMGADT
ncbi:hypothetical protein MMC27_000032 [Xylographa pallens]|nr:hypothetical protein [Xylographa pallens]